jgi:hypothetical protein
LVKTCYNLPNKSNILNGGDYVKVDDKLARIKELHNGKINSYVDSNDIDWLIQQIERYQEAFVKVESWLEDEDTDNSRWFLDNLKEIINGLK